MEILKEFNIAWRNGTIPTPESMLLGRMVMLWKGTGDGTNPSDWRGLTISQSILTLYMRMITRRLISLVMDLGVLSKNQRANLPGINGVADWNLYLRALLLDIKLAR